MSDLIVDRRTYLAGTAIAGTVGFAGCLGGGETGTLATQVTDQPGDIADFESCVVTIVGMWLGPEGAEAGDEEGEEPADREYHEYDEPQEADLVDLQGDNTQLVDERELDVATYQFLQLDVDGIDATLEGGDSATVGVPGDAPLTFNQEFEVRADARTTFTADFTPVLRGQTDEYLLQPVPDGITVEYEGDEE
ncbi:DUF4382 domain-containing protein [Halorubrum sp. CBA1229]|uniref:DUF4382 domain-containing protein n=1 Tax=Halorubrum sp. CBA1229 TaxID=1853699 RepID=UPI000F3E040B|nr:DUF4382 domain-containing protein [Halorubrum sp. CBA1229]QKY15639.1 DUF4382 domain-containing protein [Halorubrum sp. CBA1229]